MSFHNWTSSQPHNASPTPEPPLEGKLLSDALDLGYVAGQVYLLHRPIQCIVIAAIIITAFVCNVLVIHNIWMCQLKMRTVNFLLIKNLCIVDLIGACVVLPVPLLATAKGVWDFGAAMCKANSTVNIALWIQHIIMFAMLKIDRVLASCLPFGKYPIFSVEVVTVIVIISWFVSFFFAGLVTSLVNSSYEPAVVLCIPELPVEFFITIFSIYCAALLAMVIGYIVVIWYLKKKRAEIRSSQGVEVADYSGLERSALTSFLITISHFLMYVPTMLVIGLHGWFLHPIAILICDMVVYAEFSIHPIVLLSTSTKMRREIMHTIKICIQDAAAIWNTEFPRCLRHKGLVYAVTPEEPNNAESFIETVRVHNPASSTSTSTPTAFQVTNDDHFQQKSSELNRGEEEKISTAIEVVFHRNESPEPVDVKALNQSFYPVNLKHKPLNPLDLAGSKPGEISRPIRANGRSISRENCSKKTNISVSGELCRRHASLPTSPSSEDSFKDVTASQGKRHSIPVTLPSERPYHFLTSSFFSTLLSDQEVSSQDVVIEDVRMSTKDNVDFVLKENIRLSTTDNDDFILEEEIRLSTENGEMMLEEDIRLSTEIVYKFCEKIEDSPEHVATNGFLSEPALYRLELASSFVDSSKPFSDTSKTSEDSSTKVTKTRTRDLIDEDEERTTTTPADGENSKEIFI